jgi:hypothetical protein
MVDITGLNNDFIRVANSLIEAFTRSAPLAF